MSEKRGKRVYQDAPFAGHGEDGELSSANPRDLESEMAAAARVDGQEKVIAAAQHIVKSLATSKNAADDMIRILSGFDNRLSIMNDLFPSADGDASTSAAAAGSCPQDAAEEEGDEPCEVDSRLDSAAQVVLRWEDSPDSLLWEASPDEATEYIEAVDEIISLAGEDSYGDEDIRCRADSFLQLAMSRLEEEFRHLMIRNTVPLDAEGLYCSIRRVSLSSFTTEGGDPIEDLESSVADEEDQQQQEGSSSSSSHRHHHRRGGSSISEERAIDLMEPEVVNDLREIADRMIRAGYWKELSHVYSSVRRDILDECLSILGVERMSIDEVQRIEWRTLNDMMKKWIQAMKVAGRVLLPGEKRLCDEIFASSEDLKEECFTESAKGCLMQLLNFGDAISICERSSEKLFRILDMYEVLAGAVPDLQSLFDGQQGELICGEVDGMLRRLGDAVRGTLAEFANAVQKETSRKPVHGAEIHPLTRYVMNYLKLLVDYSDSLDLLLPDGGDDGGEQEHTKGGESNDSQYLGSMTPLGRRLQLLISYLEANLEDKSELYEDPGMQYIFLINNILYIVQKVKDSELRRFLGDHWIRKRRGKIRQFATSYLRASWTKVLSYLRDDGLGGSGGSSHGGSRMAVKERFKNFNMGFEEIYRTQTTWKVPDPQLREELKISISEMVIPAYRSFMGRFASQLEGGRTTAKYLKYTPEDLENYLSDLFEGSPGLSNHPSRKS